MNVTLNCFRARSTIQSTLTLLFLAMSFQLATETSSFAMGKRRAASGPGDACDPTNYEEPTPNASAAPLNISLNPDSLRKLVINDNLSILIAANRVHIAKDQVGIARGRLFPSLNLGTLLLTAGNPTFAVANIEFLVPFLVPSRWFDFFEAKYLRQAEKLSFRLMQLNTYASALSLYFTLMSDRDLKASLHNETETLRQIEQTVESHMIVGAAPEVDFKRARAQRALAEITESKVNDLLFDEVATLRHTLVESPETQFTFEPANSAPSTAESLSVAEAVPQAIEKSLELDQMYWLEKSSRVERWKKVFGFMSSSSLATSQANPTSMAFNNLHMSAGFSLGFDYFPSISLTNHNIYEQQLRQKEVKAELSETIESALNQLHEAEFRIVLANSAFNDSVEVFKAKWAGYQLGTESIFSVLETRSLQRQSEVELLRAKNQLNLLRVILHRVMVTDQFEKIEGCTAF